MVNYKKINNNDTKVYKETCVNVQKENYDNDTNTKQTCFKYLPCINNLSIGDRFSKKEIITIFLIILVVLLLVAIMTVNFCYIKFKSEDSNITSSNEPLYY